MNWMLIISGALSGLVSAARIDYLAFKSFKTHTEFKTYGWRMAFFRWCQGAVAGAIGALGFDAVAG